jgi:hypothetical protein
MDTTEIVQLLAEVRKESREFSAESFGAKHGEEFPYLLRACLQSTEFCALLAANATMFALILSIDGAEFLEALKDLQKFASNQDYNRGIYDIFWLGYALGRKVEHKENEVLEKLK